MLTSEIFLYVTSKFKICNMKIYKCTGKQQYITKPITKLINISMRKMYCQSTPAGCDCKAWCLLYKKICLENVRRTFRENLE